MTKAAAKKTTGTRGKLRIGDDWNAITIIALSQSNPLKAVAEFVENSIDAGATRIDIIRGKEKGDAYLKIKDNGRGIPRDDEGVPNFKYVATHICDSIKRQLKANGTKGMQGEFGIGLLSFWTVGEALSMLSPAADGKTYEMQMAKGDQGYSINQRRTLFEEQGTELTIKPLLSGLRQFSGEKIQWYLASELRDRIRQSGVDITVRDRTSRKEFKVEPRKYDGRLLHLPVIDDLYLELYLSEPKASNEVGLYRSGTRVLPTITDLERFAHTPWTSNYLQGIVDASRLNLTPGTRLGVIHDEQLQHLADALKPIEERLLQEIEAQQAAEDEQASQQILKTLTKAFREALITLPAEEYDWFDLKRQSTIRKPEPGALNSDQPSADELGGNHNNGTGQDEGEVLSGAPVDDDDGEHPDSGEEKQQALFDYIGPLASVRISPASSVVKVEESRTFRAISRDKRRKQIDREVLYQWRILEGDGALDNLESEIATFTAGEEPGLVKLGITATEGDLMFEAEALVTVTSTLIEGGGKSSNSESKQQGLPAYSFRRAAGELWRSEFDVDRNLVIINSGHRDFVYASKTKALKLRYICRLYSKELVIKNFPGARPDELLERMIEISLYTEENLR